MTASPSRKTSLPKPCSSWNSDSARSCNGKGSILKFLQVMAYPNTTSFEMSKVEEIERAIQQLSSDDLSEFRAWFATFDAEVWDREFDEDVQAGRLDALAREALNDWHGGRCTDL